MSCFGTLPRPIISVLRALRTPKNKDTSSVTLSQALHYAVLAFFVMPLQVSCTQCDRRELLMTSGSYLTVTVADEDDSYHNFTNTSCQPSYRIFRIFHHCGFILPFQAESQPVLQILPTIHCWIAGREQWWTLGLFSDFFLLLSFLLFFKILCDAVDYSSAF